MGTGTKLGSGSNLRRVFVGVAFAIVAAVIVLVVLAFTVFRPKQSITTVNSVKLDGFKVGFDAANLGVDINTTVILDMSVTNPNRVGFDYTSGTSEMYYRGGLVGEAIIPAGKIGAGETIETVVRLTILADRIVTNRKVYSDLIDGKLVVVTSTRIPGKVTVMRIFKRHMVMHATCDVTINVVSRGVTDSNCRSRTKF